MLVRDRIDPVALAFDAALLLLAWLIGAAVGWQRESQGRAAGLRTHALVCGASCLLSMLSFRGPGDGGRVAAQIVSGVGFLGAGVIMRNGLTVRGLTTAATIWLVAALGIAMGAGGAFSVLAVLATILSLLTLTLGKRWEENLRRHPAEAALTVRVARHHSEIGRLMGVLTQTGATVIGFDEETGESRQSDTRTVHIHLHMGRVATPQTVSAALAEQCPSANFSWDD